MKKEYKVLDVKGDVLNTGDKAVFVQGFSLGSATITDIQIREVPVEKLNYVTVFCDILFQRDEVFSKIFEQLPSHLEVIISKNKERIIRVNEALKL